LLVKRLDGVGAFVEGFHFFKNFLKILSANHEERGTIAASHFALEGTTNSGVRFPA
jgi:hypothetical protein